MVHTGSVENRSLRARSAAWRHFRTIMRLPENQESSDVGCYLEILPIEKLVWTSALGRGYQPAIRAAGTERMRRVVFTAVITLEAQRARTKYAALAMHGDESRSKKHEELGSYQGRGTALDQLVSVAML
jgi:hypothetical protein